MRLLIIPTLALALVAAGCLGGDDEAQPSPATATTATETGPAPVDPRAHGTVAPRMGQVLLRFVKAAGRADADAMWGMLSEATQASVGPTLDDFRAGAAAELHDGLGTLAGSARVVLSRKLQGAWGVAAITGEHEVESRMEHFAYGAALIQEGRVWKLELGGVVITGLKPEPLAETDPRPSIGANVGAGGDLAETLMWLDGEPLAFERGGNAPFAATLLVTLDRDLKPGRHEVVVFGATDISASAIAWTFSVQG